MRLVELKLSGYRNLKDQTINTDDPVVLLVGGNGHGKTSFLEAVFVLSYGKSFKTSVVSDIISWEQSSKPVSERVCVLEGLFSTADGTKRLCCNVRGKTRSVSLNGNRIHKASKFYGQAATVLFTPDELQLVKGGPILRRQFMDRALAVLYPFYIDHLVKYQRALKSRNLVLHKAQKERVAFDSLCNRLLSWNELLVKHGQAIAQNRLSLILGIQEKVISFYRRFVDQGDCRKITPEDIELEFKSEFVRDAKVLDKEELSEMYCLKIKQDFARGITSNGIHRDDIFFSINCGDATHEARRAASQGQARSIALSAKFAVAELIKEERGEAPILLLDDVESELDSGRKRALSEITQELESQVLISSTDTSCVLADRAKTMLVKDGRILQ